MLNYNLVTITSAMGGKLYGNSNVEVLFVITDSRVVSANANSIFFALVGVNHDGHNFVAELYSKGVRSFVVSNLADFPARFPDSNFIHVDNTLKALQHFAAYHRSQFTYKVIGITGSNGKTIVKEWLAQLLDVDFRITRSPKSYNSQLGVPLSVLQMDERSTLGIFEAGISQMGEMQNLKPIIAPTIGVFTNIGSAHQENFSDLQSKAEEKLKLFENVETLIYCKDHEIVNTVINQQLQNSNVKLFTWSKISGSDVVLKEIALSKGKSLLTILYSNEVFEVTIPFTDEASVENAMHCICTMLQFGYTSDQIQQRMQNLQPVAMRLEQKEGVNGCTIINDSYNSDLGSLAIALDFLMQQRQHSKKILILSDILQSGQTADKLYAEVASLVRIKGVHKIIGIGSEIFEFGHIFPASSQFFPSTDEFIHRYSRGEFVNSAILIKGSRKFRFERISALLEQKSHRTILEINLNALVDNLNYFRSLLKPNVKVMAMVKAFSYGSGSHEIANLLQFHRVDYLGVAFADEGVALREAGITLPIIVLNPTFESYDIMIEYNLEPEIYNFSSLQGIIAATSKQGVMGFPIHIKVDTGMHRLGFMESEIDELVENIIAHASIRVQSIFSHLAATDEVSLDEFTKTQIQCFERIAHYVSTKIGYQPIKHILNSAGIERFGYAQFDMVRLGIGLYGVSAIHGLNLQVVNSLKTYIAQIKNLKAGETVGYNRKGIITRDSVIATIPIGYADGLNRRLSSGLGHVLVNGALAPIIGNVSMDTCSIDITDIPNTNEGDEVTIFGEKPSITELASRLQTIPYEVLTSVSRRVKRVYLQE